MNNILWVTLFILLIFGFSGICQDSFQTDTIRTGEGELTITFIGHGTLMFTFKGKVVHVDPVSRYADYSSMPKADLILVTHHHGDHLDSSAIVQVSKDETSYIYSKACEGKLPDSFPLQNGDEITIKGVTIQAVPAYNLVHKRDNGEPFHPKGIGNGYVITFGDQKVYIAGDTENVPEMKQLTGIEIAFLPMNLPYTMTPVMVADATRAFKPKILYPYHFGRTDVNELLKLLRDFPDTEIRIRKME
ncbi:MAG: MBL fold metallo-hydrolase [bacterium]|nr:MAG: MBL fold metallo-hydrolase [bacterium]